MSPLRAHLFQLSLTKHAGDRAADVVRELDPAGRAPDYQTELSELKSAVNERRILDIPGELADAALAGQLGVSKATGTNLPLIGTGSTVKKRRKHQDIWRRTFAQRRIPFSEHYLSSGGDFGSPDQVQAAFLAAGKPIDEQQALQLSVRMTAMRDAGGPSLIDRDWSKSAAAPDLSKFYEILTRAKRVRGSLGAEAADRITMEHLGSVFGVANKRFYNQAGQLGITNRTPSAKVREMLSSVTAAPAPPPAQGPLGQALLPFMGKQAGFEGDFDRVLQREGKIGVTTDRAGDSRGGATQAGISQSYFGKNPDGSWKKSKAQIAALTPSEIKGIYADIYKVPNQFKDPGVREVMFDMTTNAGPGANKILQRSINRMLPNGQQLAVDSVVGPGTLAAAQGLDQRELTRNLLNGYSAHHQQLVKNRPDLYATNKNGWANRVSALRTRVLAPPAPVLVKGQLPPPPPVFINNRQPPQAPAAPVMTTQPGGPIPSMPMLSAPPQPVMGKQASLSSHLRAARNKTHQHPTEAQRHAGNYAKGRLSFRGLSIAIENPIDSIRRGTDDNGKAWESRLTADYGYFVGSTAADGDAVDVFIGPDHTSDLVVVIDHYKGATFDESKFILAVTTQKQGAALYLSNYQKGWTLGPVSTTTVQQLKTWLAEGNTKAPFKGQLVKAASFTAADAERIRNADIPVRTVVPRGMAESFHTKLKAALGQTEKPAHFKFTLVGMGSHDLDPNGKPYGVNRSGDAWPVDKSAALRPDKWERLCARRGQCPTCGQSNCEGKVCGCGKTLSNDEWKALRDKSDAGVDLRTKEAGVLQRLAPYKAAIKEVLRGSKLPPMSTALKDVPSDADDLSQLLPRVHSLLKTTFSKSAAAQPEQDTALRKDWILGGTAAAAAGGKLRFDLAAQRAKARGWEAAMHRQSRGLEDSKLHALDTDQLLNRAQDLTDDYIRGGQRTAQSKILGVTAGQVPKVHVWKDYLHRVLADKSPDRWETAAKDRTARLNHYSMFSDRALAPEAIRGHMVEKAINSLDSGVLAKLDPAVRQILTHGDAHMKDRLAAIAKIPGADVGGITKLLTTALRGNGDAAHGPARFGEMVRLAGQRGQALNTGQIYRLASGGAMKGMRGAGSATALLGGGMLAATGFSALKDKLHKSAAAAFDRAADNMSEGQRTSLAAILAGASPMSAVSGFNELRRKDLNRIGVTYGEQNYQHAEIGGGHKEPAVSLAELLEDENHRRGGKYEIARYARNRDGMLGKVEGLRSVEERLAGVKDTSRINTFERALRGDPGVNVMVNTGFGDHIPKASHKDLRFSAEGALQNHAINGRIPTRSLVNYLTDGVPYDSTAYSATAGDRNANGRTLFQSWGGGAREAHGDMKNMGVKGPRGTLANITGVNRLRHALGMSSSHTGVQHMGSDVPFALSEGKMDMIRKVRSEEDALKSLQKYIADPNADPAMARQLQEVIDAKQSGKKVVAFSGASRGDYVTTRAAELHDALQAKGRGDVHIVAQLANAINDPKQMKMLEGRGGISQFGRMPPEQFLALQNYANLHGNSTGTSSWVEALLGRGNSFQPKNWGFSLKWPDHTPMFLDDDPLRKGQLGGLESIAKRTQNRLQSLFPGIDPHHAQAGVQDWNLNHLQEQARAGRMTADSADEVLGLLDRDASNPYMAEAYERQIQGAQKKFVGSIFNEARRNKVMSRLKGGGKLLAPLAMLPAAYGLLSHENKPTGGPVVPATPTAAPPTSPALPSWLQGDNGRNLAIGGGAVAAGSLLAYLMARRHKKKRLQEA